MNKKELINKLKTCRDYLIDYETNNIYYEMNKEYYNLKIIKKIIDQTLSNLNEEQNNLNYPHNDPINW